MVEHKSQIGLQKPFQSRQMFTEDFAMAWVTVTLGQVTGKPGRKVSASCLGAGRLALEQQETI